MRHLRDRRLHPLEDHATVPRARRKWYDLEESQIKRRSCSTLNRAPCNRNVQTALNLGPIRRIAKYRYKPKDALVLPLLLFTGRIFALYRRFNKCPVITRVRVGRRRRWKDVARNFWYFPGKFRFKLKSLHTPNDHVSLPLLFHREGAEGSKKGPFAP